MDRVTRQWLEELKRLRAAEWKPGEKVMGVDVHFLIDTLVGLCRRLGPGSVVVRQERQAKLMSRLEAQRLARRFQEKIDCFAAVCEAMNESLLVVTDGTLRSLGYVQRRGNWQLCCDHAPILERFREKVDPMNNANASPLIPHMPPADEAEAITLFARARSGDAEALKRIQQLIRDRNWVAWAGDLGQIATMQLLAHVVEGDPVSRIGVMEHVKDMAIELLGEKPTFLERLLVRRVINGWIAVHTLELEQSSRPPETPEQRDHLDRAVGRAHKRLMEAVRELAHVRRLQAPRVLRELVRGNEGEVRNLIPMKED